MTTDTAEAPRLPRCPHGCLEIGVHFHETQGGSEVWFAEAERLWIFTFGFGHIHPETGDSLARCFVRIVGTIESSRARMLELFGNKWSAQYPSEEAAGVERHALIEIPYYEMPGHRHTRDHHCDVDAATDTCRSCGVHHGDPCPVCDGRGFHALHCFDAEGA